MFNKIFKKASTIRKHINAPLLEERLQYLQYWDTLGRSRSTIQSTAQYLLRIIDYLNLETNDVVVSRKKIELAANVWACYQYNHPQKKVAFSKHGKERFIWYATDWLRKLNRLELLPEETIPLFNKIFERHNALQRHASMPLVEERLRYLQYWDDNGAVKSSLRNIAQYLLVIINYLSFYELRTVSLIEIEKVAEEWAKDSRNSKRKGNYSKFAKARFILFASNWFKMLGCLKQEPKSPFPFEEYLNLYIVYMRHEQGLSENTIKNRFYQLQDFLIKINEKRKNLIQLTPSIIDEALTIKYNVNGYSRRSIQSYASVIRSFLKYAENQAWCQSGIANSIKIPRVYRHESLPYSPSWDDVKKLLANSKSDHSIDIRDYAILMLLSVYGMRCSEVINLQLEDLDWENELLYLRRAKRSKPQIFPLSKIVGSAILRYLQEVRPNNCLLRTIFLCMRSPYRPLKAAAVYQLVSRRLRPLDLKIKHHGPHALRHACATHLINEGVSLKEISDHLGHTGLETTRIYTKVDLVNLYKVAEFDLGDLL
ncbi:MULTISPECIES: tyrosine-type recombinase/integrase [unclassified Candidatus Tisiphia]|uniref:tyrosine-type recombinase/integrase n=1 Tax=unclassified Candidatus Tisiphia TaxID=2996318 RepID=UPI00312CA34D